MVDAVMPVFNQHEALVTSGLSSDDRAQLARLLRTVLRTLDTEV
jgi:DNA-binding MarR family transcriptional regulator